MNRTVPENAVIAVDVPWSVSPYPSPDEDRLPDSIPVGGWRAKSWFGAALTATDLLASDGDQAANIRTFGDTAIATWRELVA